VLAVVVYALIYAAVSAFVVRARELTKSDSSPLQRRFSPRKR